MKAWRDESEKEGGFETGCWTEHGNGLVLYVDTTRELHEWKVRMYESLLGKRLGKRAMSSRMRSRAAWLKRGAAGRWGGEMGTVLPSDRDTLRDLANWMERDFRWWKDERCRAKQIEEAENRQGRI